MDMTTGMELLNHEYVSFLTAILQIMASLFIAVYLPDRHRCLRCCVYVFFGYFADPPHHSQKLSGHWPISLCFRTRWRVFSPVFLCKRSRGNAL